LTITAPNRPPWAPAMPSWASAIDFGLGTVPTLGVVPVPYTLLFRIEIPSRTVA
jgi:hypothetical protein